MASWKKIIVSGSIPEFAGITVDSNSIFGGELKLTGLSAQNSEATSLMINGSGVVGTRELGSNAFNSTTIAVSSYTNATDNRVITSTGAGGINGEANLTFDGSTLTVSGDVEVQGGVYAQGDISGSTFGNANGSSDFTGSFAGDGSSLTGITLDVVDSLISPSGTASLDLSGDTLTIIGGNGLTTSVSGKALTVNVASANNGIVANANDIELNTASSTFTDGVKAKLNADGVISGSIQVDHDATTNFVANEHIDHSSVSITAGTGLSGGGDLTATMTLEVDLSELTDMTAGMVGTDEFIVLDNGADRRKAANEIGLSIFNNDAGFTTNTGDIEGVTAGNGLTGGGTTGTVTLNVGAGTGIDVAADAISVDVSDFMTNGVNNRVLTATGTDAMNAEANLTFDGSLLTVTGNATVTGNLTVQGTTTTLDTTNLLIEDRYILLNSGSSTESDDSGIIFGGSSGAAGSGSALIWDGSYNSNDGRLAVVNALAQNASANATPNYYVAGFFDGDEASAATAQADHRGNIRVDSSDDIWIYV